MPTKKRTVWVVSTYAGVAGVFSTLSRAKKYAQLMAQIARVNDYFFERFELDWEDR